jgi:alkanesulfonate monooxygenase SsuD/methylene tetrahydromethanopterin reductase-like flavin-dependent oxidoreductase (luciferase family)
MKLGFFTMPMHPPSRDYTQTLKKDREAVIFADKLGFCEAFIGEHVTDICESIPSCLAFIASVAFATRQIKLGSGTVNLPNNHPAQVAADVAMLDHMLEGRFLFGIGPGGLRSDMEMLGNLDRDRNAMFVEAIDQILAIWAGDAPYNLKGQFWNLSTERTLLREAGQGVMVKPYQRPHPPIVVTAIVPHSKGLVAAARRGWTPITANFLQPSWAATHWPMHAQGCELGGHKAERRDWRVCKSIFVADDDATARRYRQRPARRPPRLVARPARNRIGPPRPPSHASWSRRSRSLSAADFRLPSLHSQRSTGQRLSGDSRWRNLCGLRGNRRSRVCQREVGRSNPHASNRRV